MPAFQGRGGVFPMVCEPEDPVEFQPGDGVVWLAGEPKDPGLAEFQVPGGGVLPKGGKPVEGLVEGKPGGTLPLGL